MTTIETTIINDALAQIEQQRQAIARALSLENDRLDDDFAKHIWERLAWISKQLRRAESVVAAHSEEACPSLREDPANDWRGVTTL